VLDMTPRRLTGLPQLELDDRTRVYVATGAWIRLVGLAWLDDLPENRGLLLPRCNSIHTFGMRFALDVDFLGADGQTLRRCQAVPPRRVLWCRGAVAVLERKAR
jgi:uncharacterized membrane protein (UPF0127 family)